MSCTRLPPDYPFCSNRIGINFYALNPELIAVDERETKLIEYLNHYGVETMPIKNTYTRELGGGIHCQTNEIEREDPHGFKRILQTPREQLSQKQLAGLWDLEFLKHLQNSGKDTEDWEKLCNEERRFPTYLTDHLTQEQKKNLEEKHKESIKQYFES